MQTQQFHVAALPGAVKRAVIGGVCAGLADYFGFNLKATRILAVISLFMAMPVTLLAYFGAVFLIPATTSEQLAGVITIRNFAGLCAHLRHKQSVTSGDDFNHWTAGWPGSKDT